MSAEPVRPKRGRGRPRRDDPDAKPVAMWDDEASICMLQMRYEEFPERFESGTYKVELGGAWVHLARVLSERVGRPFDSGQCQTKLRLLRKSWKRGMEEIESGRPRSMPPGNALFRKMCAVWGDHGPDGVPNELVPETSTPISNAVATTGGVALSPAETSWMNSAGDAAGPNPRKRRYVPSGVDYSRPKTTGDGIEAGLVAIAEAIKSVGQVFADARSTSAALQDASEKQSQQQMLEHQAQMIERQTRMFERHLEESRKQTEALQGMMHALLASMASNQSHD